MRSIDCRSCVRLVLPLLLVLLTGCSGDDKPSSPHPASSVPEVPTVTEPNGTLPDSSSFLTVESALLRNFSPNLSGGTHALFSRLNAAYVYDFLLHPGHHELCRDGRLCAPPGLLFSLDGASGFAEIDLALTPTPYTYLGSRDGSYYYLFTTPAPWAFADVSCRNFGGHLVCLGSAEEEAFVLNAFASASQAEGVFIGFTDWARQNNDYTWVSWEPVVWTNWIPGQPDDSNGEHFAHLTRPGSPANGRWNDVGKEATLPYVMETRQRLPETDGQVLGRFNYHYSCFVFLDDLGKPTVPPRIERRLYWRKVFQKTLGPGSSYSQQQSYKLGTSETTGMSFGRSIGASVSAEWGAVSAAIQSEFREDFSHEITVSSEKTYTEIYEGTAPMNKIMLLALWQLRERYVITDGAGHAWADPNFDLAGPVPSLDQGLDQEYLQTILFDVND